jgi:hypothetical protein
MKMAVFWVVVPCSLVEVLCRISGSHGGKKENDCILGCSAV